MDFDAIYEEYQRPLDKFIRYQAGLDDAEDASQEFWLAVHRGLDKVLKSENRKHYLHRIAWNVLKARRSKAIEQRRRQDEAVQWQTLRREYLEPVDEDFPSVSKKFCALHSFYTMRHGEASARRLWLREAGESGGERLDRIAAKLGSIAAVLGFDKGRLVDAILQGANTIPTTYFPEAPWESLIPSDETAEYHYGSWLYVRFPLVEGLSPNQPPERGQAWLYELPSEWKELFRVEAGPAPALPTETKPWEVEQLAFFREWGATCPCPKTTP